MGFRFVNRMFIHIKQVDKNLLLINFHVFLESRFDFKYLSFKSRYNATIIPKKFNIFKVINLSKLSGKVSVIIKLLLEYFPAALLSRKCIIDW